jgi:hypothetical protein
MIFSVTSPSGSGLSLTIFKILAPSSMAFVLECNLILTVPPSLVTVSVTSSTAADCSGVSSLDGLSVYTVGPPGHVVTHVSVQDSPRLHQYVVRGQLEVFRDFLHNDFDPLRLQFLFQLFNPSFLGGVYY